MHIVTCFLLGLPLALAGSVSVNYNQHLQHVKRDKKEHLGPNQADVCNSGHIYTFPYCTKDSDCQRPGSKLSNLPPTGIPAMDIAFKYGDGYCYTGDDKNHTKTCASQIYADDDIAAYCHGLVGLFKDQVPGLIVLSECVDPKNPEDVICDLYCDPKVSAACDTPQNYSIPCANLTIGGPASLACPNSKLPQDDSGPGDKYAPSGNNNTAPAPGPGCA